MSGELSGRGDGARRLRGDRRRTALPSAPRARRRCSRRLRKPPFDAAPHRPSKGAPMSLRIGSACASPPSTLRPIPPSGARR